MSDVSIADAKAQFAHLVHLAEAGQPVRSTRRGRAVAVLIAEADYRRMMDRSQGLLAYTAAWRAQAAEAQADAGAEIDWASLRDQHGRLPPDLG